MSDRELQVRRKTCPTCHGLGSLNVNYYTVDWCRTHQAPEVWPRFANPDEKNCRNSTTGPHDWVEGLGWIEA